MTHCRDCTNRARKNRYYRDLDHERARGNRYYQENRERAIERNKAYAAQWRRERPDAVWAYELKKAHGLMPEQWYVMWEEQDGLCYLCEQPLPPNRSKVAIDHDHSHCPKGKSCGACRRGMAHSNCNSGIGLLGDSPALLRLAADKLERAQAVTAARIATASAQGELFGDGDVSRAS